MDRPQDVYAVIGGSGLIGRQIVDKLKARGDTVFVLDVTQRHDDVPFHHVDVTNKDGLRDTLKRCGATCVFHLASPHAGTARAEVFWKVNVEGTKNVIAASVEAGVRKLIYTSSSGVVFNGKPLNGVDETYPFPAKHMDVYMETKAKAEELVLAANGKDGLLTVAIRPCGVFGPGDRQLMQGLATAFDRGQTGTQIGDNTNLVDWTYVANVAQGEILAADKVDLPVTDPSMAVAGEVFFITNDEPWRFWDFTHKIWDKLYELYPGHQARPEPRVIPAGLGMVFAACSEFIAWLLKKPPIFTRFNVIFMSTPRWYNVSKAKRVLGYKPEVSVDEGIMLVLNWWKSEYPDKPSDVVKD